jgi:hypothetical protein
MDDGREAVGPLCPPLVRQRMRVPAARRIKGIATILRPQDGCLVTWLTVSEIEPTSTPSYFTRQEGGLSLSLRRKSRRAHRGPCNWHCSGEPDVMRATEVARKAPKV